MINYSIFLIIIIFPTIYTDEKEICEANSFNSLLGTVWKYLKNTSTTNTFSPPYFFPTLVISRDYFLFLQMENL